MATMSQGVEHRSTEERSAWEGGRGGVNGGRRGRKEGGAPCLHAPCLHVIYHLQRPLTRLLETNLDRKIHDMADSPTCSHSYCKDPGERSCSVDTTVK